MSSYTIASLVGQFNTLAITVMSIFAVYGAVAIAGIKLWPDFFRRRTFVRAFCVASLVALAAEATFFNWQHYLKFFSGPEIHTTDISAGARNFINLSDGGKAALVKGQLQSYEALSGMLFEGFNKKVTSVYVKLNYINTDQGQMIVTWMDEESIRQFQKRLYRHLPHENYVPLQSRGKVSEIGVMFGAVGGSESAAIEIVQVAINKTIPLYFSGLRIFVVALLVFAVISLFSGTLRARLAHFLFEYKFDPASLRQNAVYALAVILLIAFSWICVYTSVRAEGPPHRQYNEYLVDALIKGRTYLDYGNPEKLLNAERPYDTKWLSDNGYKRDVDWMWDWAWYKGKHYSYFGVVPAVILYVPHKLITGAYLSNQAGVFLFAAVSVVLLALLWRHCVRKYMPNLRFAFYLLAFLTLFFASGLFSVLRLPSFYTIVQTAGYMFALAGILLLLRSVDEEGKTNRLKLFFSCLCFALIVGCRPNMFFAAILIPFVLWKRRSWKLLRFILIPFAIVAIPLCWYNYARFGSIFEFGANYNLTSFNMTAYALLNPIGKISGMFTSALSYLFLPNSYSLNFPLIQHLPRPPSWITHGAVLYSDSGSGIINFPIVLCLLCLFKNILVRERRKIFSLSLVFLLGAAVIIALNSYVVGFVGRYTLDFATFIILPSLFCAWQWCGGRDGEQLCSVDRQGVVYALLAISIFTGLFLFVTGGSAHPHSDPVLYRYLEYSLGVIRAS